MREVLWAGRKLGSAQVFFSGRWVGGATRALWSVSDHRAKSVAGQWTAGPLEWWEAGQLDVVSTMVFHWLCDSGHFTPSSRDEEVDG